MLVTVGMNESRDTIRFKVASPTIDTLHSSSPSVIEVHDSATRKVTCSIF